MIKVSPTELNFGYDVVLLVLFFGTPCMPMFNISNGIMRNKIDKSLYCTSVNVFKYQLFSELPSHATCMILKTNLLMFCLDFLCRQEELTLSLQELGGFVRARLEFLMWKHRRHGTLTISALSPLLS